MGKSVAVVVAVAVTTAAVLGCSQTPPPAPAPEAPLPKVVAKAEAPRDRRDVARDALKLHEEKKWADAVPALIDAAAKNPAVAPFLRLRLVDAYVGLGDLSNAAATASEIIALSDTTAATVARLRLPQIYAQLGDRAATDAAHQQAMNVAIDEHTEADFVSMATALAKAGRTDLATATRVRLINDYTNGRYTEQTYGFLKSEIAQWTPEQKLALASKLSRANRYDQALELFAQIPEKAAEARAIHLRALFNSRNYSQLLDETKDETLTDPALILLRARAAWRDDRRPEFLAGLARLETEFPASAQASEARVQRAKYYVTDEIDYAKSVDDLTNAIEAGAAGSDGENLWNLGWTYTLWGKDAEALKTYDRYIRSYPDGDWKTNSLFWSAKTLERLGRPDERNAKARQIVDEYPFSYYAYRAKELWPEIASMSSSSMAATSANSFPDIEAELLKVDDPRFAIVDELLEIGLHRAAAREMKVVAAKYADNPGVQFLLADVYVRGGEPFKANGVLQRQFRPFIRHGGTNIPPRFWQILYPLAYWETIQSEAARRNLDPYLVASIIRQESGFEPTTVSNAGAVGLMQIMPAEASRIGTNGGLGEITRDDLFDPVKNIAVGAAEYAQKLALMNGNDTLAIASYNAGEAAVETWLQRTPFTDRDVFIESIPYAETRLYVKTVTRNRSEYRRIYESLRQAHASPGRFGTSIENVPGHDLDRFVEPTPHARSRGADSETGGSHERITAAPQ
ncbi:MAG TPA: transglycosylase SLT domain-containing protein [Thermoanaerobaculia bacterium]|nr:transglycosylase SLT domain-containing protein [Thermoanaerobaculia bacterium]